MVFRLLENAFMNQNIGEGLKKDCAEGSNTPCKAIPLLLSTLP